MGNLPGPSAARLPNNPGALHGPRPTNRLRAAPQAVRVHAGLTGERPSFKDSEDAATSLVERLERKNCLHVAFRLLKAGALALEGQHRPYSS